MSISPVGAHRRAGSPRSSWHTGVPCVTAAIPNGVTIMRYLVTGATGFLGRHVLARLLARPGNDAAEITCLVRSPGRLAARTANIPGHRRLVAVRGDLTLDGLGLTEA